MNNKRKKIQGFTPKKKKTYFCSTKNVNNVMKRQTKEWEKIFANHILIRV
jgi:hypothetical protein